MLNLQKMNFQCVDYSQKNGQKNACIIKIYAIIYRIKDLLGEQISHYDLPLEINRKSAISYHLPQRGWRLN